MKIKKLLIVLVIPFLFFITSFLTLKDYGVNWDEPWHYIRGQAFFQYLISGKTDYSSVTGRKSYFQKDYLDGVYFLKNDSAHPPANDILASLFNYIFFRKLNILGDIESYHLFIIIASTLGVAAVSLFAYEVLGVLGAIVAGFVMASYPLFFSEAHFNIKDPVETAFFTLTIWAFWKSLQKGSWKWLIFSLVSCGLALGTKFNIVFLPFIILPHLIIRYGKNILKVKIWFKKIPLSYKICLLLSPAIVLGVFVYLWPFLWHSPVKNFIDAVRYYQDIGTGVNYETRFLLFKQINLYPIYWVVITTPPFVLLLFLAGIVTLFFRRISKTKAEILWLIWFLVVILRVTLPQTSIYGGVRQIMEYIPAMALISGFGAVTICNLVRRIFKINNKYVLPVILFLAFIPQILEMIRIHPNENVYFNFLVGGLRGAKEKNIPSAGNSYGNAYLQAVKWINKNVEPNAKLALVQGTGQNIPQIELREDIQFSNNNWTGIYRGGEYMIELNIDPISWAYPYCWEYVTKLLEPVYEVKVDGVVLASVWKNDLEHTKTEYREIEKAVYPRKVRVNKNVINIVLDKKELVTSLFLNFNNLKCSTFAAKVETSTDGLNWTVEKEKIPSNQIYAASKIKPEVNFFFAAREAKEIKITGDSFYFCSSPPLVKVNYL